VLYINMADEKCRHMLPQSVWVLSLIPILSLGQPVLTEAAAIAGVLPRIGMRSAPGITWWVFPSMT